MSPSRWARFFELPLLALTLVVLFGAASHGESTLLSPLSTKLTALSIDEHARAPLPELPEGSWLVIQRAGVVETLSPGNAPPSLERLGETRWRWLLKVTLRGMQYTPPTSEGASLLAEWAGLDVLSLWSQEILLAPPERLIEGRSGVLPP